MFNDAMRREAEATLGDLEKLAPKRWAQGRLLQSIAVFIAAHAQSSLETLGLTLATLVSHGGVAYGEFFEALAFFVCRPWTSWSSESLEVVVQNLKADYVTTLALHAKFTYIWSVHPGLLELSTRLSMNSAKMFAWLLYLDGKRALAIPSNDLEACTSVMLITLGFALHHGSPAVAGEDAGGTPPSSVAGRLATLVALSDETSGASGGSGEVEVLGFLEKGVQTAAERCLEEMQEDQRTAKAGKETPLEEGSSRKSGGGRDFSQLFIGPGGEATAAACSCLAARLDAAAMRRGLGDLDGRFVLTSPRTSSPPSSPPSFLPPSPPSFSSSSSSPSRACGSTRCHLTMRERGIALLAPRPALVTGAMEISQVTASRKRPRG